MAGKVIKKLKILLSFFLTLIIPFEMLFNDINLAITASAANYTVIEEDLFKYPKLTYYLENEEYNNILRGFHNDCISALNTVTTSEEIDAVIIDSFSNGASYITTEIGAMFGLCDDNFDKANKALAMEVLEEYMVTTFVGSDGYLETTGYFSDAADILGFADGALDFSKAVDEERFKNTLSSLDEYYSYEDLDELLGTGGVRDKISTAIGVYDDSVEFNKVLFSALALAQLDYVAVNDLLENVDVNTDLWRALYSIRSDIEKDKVEYVLKTYLSNQAVKKISKALKNVALKSFSKSSTILVSVFVDLAEFVYGKFKPSVNDIHHAFMMQSYVIEAERSLHDIEDRFRSGHYTDDDISAYKSTYNFYLACMQQYLKKCKTLVDKSFGAIDITSADEKKIKAKLEQDISIINGMSYNSYINRCLSTAQKAVDNGTVTINANAVVIKDKTGKVIDENYDSTESIRSKLEAIQAVYKPNVGQKWTASYQGCIQCCGFAKLVFNKLYGYDISGYVGNKRYMLSNESNVIKVGQLVGNNVTVNNLKNMFSNAKIGDYIQMNGSTYGQHSAIFLGMDDSGVTVYDCNWDSVPCVIHTHKFTWNNLYNWYSQPSSASMNGVSVYRAANYATIYGDGDDLFYDDSVNLVIQDGVLVKYNGFASYVIIPDTVTEIGDNAFKGNTYIEFVEIPDTVTKIGNYAFQNCTQLKSIYIPNSVEEIGKSAFSDCISLGNVRLSENEKFTIINSSTFYNCKKIDSIDIPICVTTIQGSAFSDCDSLINVDLPKKLVHIRNSAFARTPITDITIPKSLETAYNSWDGYAGPFYECDKLENIHFEDGITEIRAHLFYGCSGIKEIEIPDSITTIEEGAFYNCDNLVTVDISDSVTTIQNSAFYDCDSLTNVDLPKKLVHIRNSAFARTPITDITIPKSLETAYNSWDGYTGPFFECDKLENIHFEDGITEIRAHLFYGCSGIKEIEIPDSVTTIEEGAFYDCDNLVTVDISDSVTTIQNSAFYDCDSLTNVDLPKKLVHIRNSAFARTPITDITIPKSLETAYNSWDGYTGPFLECEKLENIHFEDGITEIRAHLFYGCSGIKEIKIPDSVTTIEESAFYNCDNLVNVEIPDSVTSIQNSAFGNCDLLENVKLSVQCETIPSGMFDGCKSLLKINIPNTVNSINSSAFSNCTSLEKVVIPSNCKTIGNSAFSNCTGLEKVVIPSSCKTIGNSAFSHCESLTDLTISEGVQTIESNAFEYNLVLKSVTLPDSLTSLGNKTFQYCETLDTVNLGNGITSIPKYCFYQDPNLVSIVLPQQVTKVDEYAFANCTKFTDITMNRKVNSASLNAFSYPAKLTIHGISGTYAQTFANSNNIKFTALNKNVQNLNLSTDTLNIGKGESIRLIVALDPIDASDELVWVSTDEDVVTVDNDGNINALNTGEATVMVMAGDVSAECNVIVYKAVSSVSLNCSSYTGTIGDVVNLSATVYPKDATYKTYRWSSSDDNVASVDDNGTVTLNNYGTATITVTTDDKNKTANCTISVEPISVSSIKLNYKSTNIAVGGTVELIPTISPENATNKNVIWTSNKTSVATVDNGVVTGLSEGKAIIIAKTEDGSKTASCTVNVGNEQDSVKVKEIKINEGNTELFVGDNKKLNISISPSNASNKSVTWSSDNKNVATVDNNGNLKAISIGSAKITVKANDGSNISCTCTITVKQKQNNDNLNSNGTITTSGIYCASNYPTIQAGINIQKSNENDDVEYRWVACNNSDPEHWFEISSWTKNNNWMSWTPEKSGGYVFVCYARVVGNEDVSQIQATFGTEYHKDIKGICQMPYTGEGGGYLIGIESYDNPNNSYQYEMLILDCNLYMQGQDAWVYTTGRCGAQGNCLWTIWQPVYGYYWTLFRIYDSNGVLIDEACYGFENVN